MYMLQITQCKDPLMWYADKVGQLVPMLGAWAEGYKSKEPAGYINIVRFEDARIVWRYADGTIEVINEYPKPLNKPVKGQTNGQNL